MFFLASAETSLGLMTCGRTKRSNSGALVGFFAAAEEVADDRNLREEADLGAVVADFGALETAEDNHLAVVDVDERSRLTGCR